MVICVFTFYLSMRNVMMPRMILACVNLSVMLSSGNPITNVREGFGW